MVNKGIAKCLADPEELTNCEQLHALAYRTAHPSVGNVTA